MCCIYAAVHWQMHCICSCTLTNVLYLQLYIDIRVGHAAVHWQMCCLCSCTLTNVLYMCCTLTNAFQGIRGLHMWRVFFIPPHGQPHAIFRGLIYFWKVYGIMQGAYQAEASPHKTDCAAHNSILMHTSCCWLLLYSAILCSRADSLHSHVIIHGWIDLYSVFLNIRWSGVLTVLAWLVPHETAAIAAHSVYTMQPCTMSLHAKPHM